MAETKYIESRRVRELTFSITYADTTSAVMFTLPAGVRIIAWILNVKTGFSGGVNHTIDIGILGDTDYYVDGASVAAQGNVALGTALIQPGAETTEITPVYFDGIDGSDGSVDVTCLFSQETDTPF